VKTYVENSSITTRVDICFIMFLNYTCNLPATIEIRLYRKGTYILKDIHGMDHFCTKLAPPPYNKPRSCVSKIYIHLWGWYGRISYCPYICYFGKNPIKSLGAAPTCKLSMARTSANYIGPFSTNSLISMPATQNNLQYRGWSTKSESGSYDLKTANSE
jgi:hypothetical protein